MRKPGVKGPPRAGECHHEGRREGIEMAVLLPAAAALLDYIGQSLREGLEMTPGLAVQATSIRNDTYTHDFGPL